MSPLPNNHRVRVTYRLYLAQVHKSVLAHVYRVWWIGFLVLGLRFFPLFVWLSAVRLVFFWEPNPLSLAWIGPLSVFLASLTVHALRSFGGGRC